MTSICAHVTFLNLFVGVILLPINASAAVDLAGIYSRWDLINIQVRQEPYEPVVSREPVERSPSESERLHDLEARVKQLEQHIAKLLSDARIDI